MKNLQLVAERVAQIPRGLLVDQRILADALAGLDLAAVVLDAPSHRVFLVTRQLQFVAFSLQQHEVTYTLALVHPDLLEAGDTIVGCHYLPECELVHVSTSDGNLLTLSPDGSAPPTIVGCIAVGIAAMAWSPDEELCVIYNRASQVVVMTREFDVMYEKNIFATATSSSSSTPPAATAEQIAAAHARYGYGSISWRGDGQFFVLNALDPVKCERVLLVFDRQLESQSVSAGCKPAPLDGSADGLSASALAWRPSGNLIFTAASRKISDSLTKREVWMWEKNGLRHGEISLGNVIRQAASSAAPAAAAGSSSAAPKSKKKVADDDDGDNDGEGDEDDYTDEVDETAGLDSALASSNDAQVIDLAWNADSDILAVRLEEQRHQHGKVQTHQSIVLYTTGNYHWYLKMEIRPTTEGAQIHARWHAEDARRLLIIESTGLTRYLDLVWDVDVSSTQTRLATVIDGASCLLTPLAKCCVPPPMSTWKLVVPVEEGRVVAVAMKASDLPSTGAFTLPNQQLEATAFQPLPLPPSIEPFVDSFPSFAPLTDLALVTSTGVVYLVSAVEDQLGNGFSGPDGQRVKELKNVERCTLKSEDFPLGCLRLLEWLPVPSSSRAPAPSTVGISESRPAMLLAVESTPGAPDALVELQVFGGEIQSMFRTPLPPALGSAAATQPTILRVATHAAFGRVFVHLSNGHVLRYLPACWQTSLPIDDRYPILAPAPDLALPTACAWFDVVAFDGVLHPAGRDNLGKLYLASQLLSPQCSSFQSNAHPLYMCFSILGQQNAVFLLDKAKSLDENMSPAARSDPHLVRLVERGSTLTAIIPSLTLPRLILQMPRGNLEAIYPRNFNLAAINSALASLQLKEALINLRRNKIDSNLLFDHYGFALFPRIAREFIRQVGWLDQPPGIGVEMMNLFLSGLTEESSLDNQYVKYHPMPLTPEAEAILARSEAALAEEGGATSASATGGGDRMREKLMRSIDDARRAQYEAAGEVFPRAQRFSRQQGGAANSAAAANDEDALSDAGSLDSGAGGGGANGANAVVHSHDAIGEAQPYNYVPRKKGETRRGLKTPKQRAEHGKMTKSKEEGRREKQRAGRVERERLAEEYERQAVEVANRKGKVNFVCDLMRELFQEEERRLASADAAALASDPKAKKRAGRFTLCILTCFLKNDPKNYDAALALVKQMRDAEKRSAIGTAKAAAPSSTVASSARARTAARGVEQSSLENKSLSYSGYTGALQYMIFLSDIQTLYRSALGIYDFELVRLVAQYSHMDPKEYLAFLEKLQAMDPPRTPAELAANEATTATGATGTPAASSTGKSAIKRQPHYQHYQIDLYLQRWSRALTSLLCAWRANEIPRDSTHWELVLSLLKDHPDLYTQAIEEMTPEKVRDQTRLVLAGGGGGGGYGGRSDMYGGGMSHSYDPTGGLPAHFLNPSLAPQMTPQMDMSSTNAIASSSSNSGTSGGSSSSSTPDAPESDELTPYFSLLRAYATQLTASGSSVSARHAAHAFLLCCEYRSAVLSLKEAGEWKEAMVLAYQLKFTPSQLQQLAYELATQLRTETKTAGAAAQLLVDYCDDVDEAVVILVAAELWFEMLRVCYQKGREDLIETHGQPEVLKAYARHIKHIQTHSQRYSYAIQRLRVIRRVKLLFPPTSTGVGADGEGGADGRDDDLMSIVSGVSASTAYSGVSHTTSEASAFSGRSTSTVASTSSIFSIQAEERREMTGDERRIARHQSRLKRSLASKRVKEGSIYEEEMMIKEVVETTPLDKHKERMSELIHALLHMGYVDQSRTLQYELTQFLRVVAAEEARPMPMLENPTPEQREALIKYWNWPGMAHPERGQLAKHHLTMPFLFVAPSQKAADQEKKRAAQDQQDQQKRLAQTTTPNAGEKVRGAHQPKAALDEAEEDGLLGGMMM